MVMSGERDGGRQVEMDLGNVLLVYYSISKPCFSLLGFTPMPGHQTFRSPGFWQLLLNIKTSYNEVSNYSNYYS